MTSVGVQLAGQDKPDQDKNQAGAQPAGRSLMAHLLHALNQPLTGLQCALELAVAGPKPTDQYVQTLREGLELTGRMRVLVDAIRELSDLQQWNRRNPELVRLDEVFRQTASDLSLVARAKRLQMRVEMPVPLPVESDRSRLTNLAFRLLDSALALSREDAPLEISGWRDGQSVSVQLSWCPGPALEHSPFSPAELGCSIAQAGWEQTGAAWGRSQSADKESCTLRFPLASSFPPEQVADWES